LKPVCLYKYVMRNRTTPFTYLIGWSKHNVFYYGVRYARGCQPSDLWSIYFTSSSPVKRFRQTHGDPDIISIRRTFNTSEAARDWELRVLKRLQVVVREDFLNQHDSPTPSTRGLKLGPRPADVIERISATSKGRVNRHTDESRRKISESLSGRTFSDSHKAALSRSLVGKTKGQIDRISYVVVSPEGKEYPVNGRLEAVCSTLSLNRKSLYNTLKTGHPISFGKSKGWRLISSPCGSP